MFFLAFTYRSGSYVPRPLSGRQDAPVRDARALTRGSSAKRAQSSGKDGGDCGQGDAVRLDDLPGGAADTLGVEAMRERLRMMGVEIGEELSSSESESETDDVDGEEVSGRVPAAPPAAEDVFLTAAVEREGDTARDGQGRSGRRENA